MTYKLTAKVQNVPPAPDEKMADGTERVNLEIQTPGDPKDRSVFADLHVLMPASLWGALGLTIGQDVTIVLTTE